MRSSSMMLAVTLSGAISVAWSLEEPPAPAPLPASATASPSAPSAAQPASVAQPNSNATAATAPPASTTSSASTAKPGGGNDSDAERRMRQIRARGYKAENHNGATMYCITEPSIGTKFPTKKCATAEELDTASQRGQDFQNSIKNYGNPKTKNN
jgi:hypothetical protein